MPQVPQKKWRATSVWKRYSRSASSPARSSKRSSWTMTMSAFLRRQIEQSQVVSSGKSVVTAKRTAPQWQLPSQRAAVRKLIGIPATGLPRQLGDAHQRLVDRAGALPAFADRPHDQRLAAAHVAAGEHAVLAGGVAQRVGGELAALIERHAGLRQQPGLPRSDEAHRQQDQVGGKHELAARDLLHLPAGPLDP